MTIQDKANKNITTASSTAPNWDFILEQRRIFERAQKDKQELDLAMGRLFSNKAFKKALKDVEDFQSVLKRVAERLESSRPRVSNIADDADHSSLREAEKAILDDIFGPDLRAGDDAED